MNSKAPILEGWKEVGDFLGKYSARHARRLFYSVKDRLKLKHWLGPGRRVKMSQEEAEQLKKLVRI